MKFEFNKRYTTIAVYAFLVLAATLLFGQVISKIAYFQSEISMIFRLLTPFIYAFGIAYILNPVLKFTEHILFRRFHSGKLKRGISMLISYLFAVGLLTVFFVIVLPRLINSLSSLALEIFSFLHTSQNWMPYITELMPNLDINETILHYFQQSTATILNTLYSTATQLLPWMKNFSAGLASGLLNVVVGIIISIYMLMNKESFCAGIKRSMYAFLPHKSADWTLELASDANRIFGGFIGGKILDSIIIGIICFLGLLLLRIPNALLVSVIVGVTNVIPYFGPFIGAIPAFFIILIDDPMKSFVFLIFILILQQFDGNILGPKILGDSTGLSAFWVIFSIMLFGGLYGFIGMFLGVPVFSVILMLFGRLVRNSLNKRNMPMELDSYCAPESRILGQDKPGTQHAEKPRKNAHTVKQMDPSAVAPEKEEKQ